ncbi:hypothetical protein T484DRAFT_2789754 [Baffinella frigidus]|nr:hypothetical protein T484DRAFT_2789754 [Cryptophyta sp. CCMP2293]
MVRGMQSLLQHDISTQPPGPSSDARPTQRDSKGFSGSESPSFRYLIRRNPHYVHTDCLPQGPRSYHVGVIQNPFVARCVADAFLSWQDREREEKARAGQTRRAGREQVTLIVSTPLTSRLNVINKYIIWGRRTARRSAYTPNPPYTLRTPSVHPPYTLLTPSLHPPYTLLTPSCAPRQVPPCETARVVKGRLEPLSLSHLRLPRSCVSALLC